MKSVNMLHQVFVLLALMCHMCHAQSTPAASDSKLSVVYELESFAAKLRPLMENAEKTLINVAACKNATQVSTYEGADANRAVDNNFAVNFNEMSCSHTVPIPAGSTERAWWQVDLGRLYPVYAVVITNRDIVGDRARDFDVQISKSDPQFQTSTLCYHFEGPLKDGVTEKFPCIDAPIQGRYVRVLNGPGMCLTLCEVQVLSKLSGSFSGPNQ